MRIRYKDKDETFLEKHLVSKEPFGQFKAWFEEACTRKEILEPNAMCLATATKYVFKWLFNITKNAGFLLNKLFIHI